MIKSRNPKSHDALEWIAAMGTHVPLRGEQMVRCYGEPIESRANVTSHTECESSRESWTVKNTALLVENISSKNVAFSL